MSTRVKIRLSAAIWRHVSLPQTSPFNPIAEKSRSLVSSRLSKNLYHTPFLSLSPLSTHSFHSHIAPPNRIHSSSSENLYQVKKWKLHKEMAMEIRPKFLGSLSSPLSLLPPSLSFSSSSSSNFSSSTSPGTQNENPKTETVTVTELEDKLNAEEFPVTVLEELAKSCEESFGDHLMSANTNLNLAHAYFREGDDGIKSFQAAEKAWKFFDRESAKGSLQRVMCLHIMGAAKNRQGLFHEGIPLIEMAIRTAEQGMEEEGEGEREEREKMERVLYASHMVVGEAWECLGGAEDARESFRKALSVQERQLGPDDPRLAATWYRLASSCALLLRLAEAEEAAKKALALHLAAAKGEDTLEEAQDRRLLGAIYSGMEEGERAVEELERAREILSRIGQNLDVAFVEGAIGDALLGLGREEEAREVLVRCVERMEEMLGRENVAVAGACGSLAAVELRLGRREEAERLCEKALTIYGKQRGEEALSTEAANGLTEIAGLFESLGIYGKALDLLRRALLIRLKIPGQTLAAAGTEANMAVLLMSAKFFKEAFTVLESCLEKLIISCGENHPMVVRALYYQATAVIKGGKEVGEREKAIEILERAKGILAELEGEEETVEAIDIFSSLSEVYEEEGRIPEAVTSLEKAINTKLKILGENHPDVIASKKHFHELKKKSENES